MSPAQAQRRQGSWVLRYRHGGRQREVTLGNYPDMPLADARKAATAARAKVDAGVDVATAKRGSRSQSAAARTFRQFSEGYVARSTDLAERTRREVQRYLDKDLLPRLGHYVARDIGSEDVVDTIKKIAERSDSVARHAFEMLSVIFADAVGSKAVPSNPCAGP